jgi:hypothetical protein
MVNMRLKLEALAGVLATWFLAVHELEQQALKVATDAWLEAGGCESCRGSGELAPATVDYDAVPCRKCRGPESHTPAGERARAAGHAPMLGAYRLGQEDPFMIVPLPPQVGEARARLRQVEAAYGWCKRAATPEKGKQVRVYKGRKVPVGTTGTCIWIGNGNYGLRAGVKDAAGTIHWTAANNLEVLFNDNDLSLNRMEV